MNTYRPYSLLVVYNAMSYPRTPLFVSQERFDPNKGNKASQLEFRGQASATGYANLMYQPHGTMRVCSMMYLRRGGGGGGEPEAKEGNQTPGFLCAGGG